MDVETNENFKQVGVLDLSDVQPYVPTSQPKYVYVPESIVEPIVYTNIVEANVSQDYWQGPYIDYLLHKTLPENPNLQTKLKH